MINALLTANPAHLLTELDPIANRICEEHQRCIHSPKTALIHACNAGVGLIEAQSKLSPERWQHWVTTHCLLRLETAEIYMKMASHCSHFPQNLQLYSTVQPQQNCISLPPQPSREHQATDSRCDPSNNPFSILNSVSQTKDIPRKSDPETESSITPLENDTKTEPISALEPSPEAVIDVDFVPTPPPSSSASKTGVIRFCLAGGVVPKARPRVTSRGTYLPQRYRAWRNQAEVELYRQMCELHPAPQFPLKKAAISLRFFGNHRTNSDIDNLAGACLDALTLNGAGILQDDRLSCLPQLSVEFVPGTPETGVWIEIEPLV